MHGRKTGGKKQLISHILAPFCLPAINSVAFELQLGIMVAARYYGLIYTHLQIHLSTFVTILINIRIKH